MLKILDRAFDDAVSVFKNPTASHRNAVLVAALTHSSLLIILGLTLLQCARTFGGVRP